MLCHRTREQRDHAGLRHGPRARHRGASAGVHARAPATVRRWCSRWTSSRAAGPAHQVHRLPLRRRLRRSRSCCNRAERTLDRDGSSARRGSRGAARALRGVLGARRRRDRRRPAAAAGRPLQPLPAAPGDGARRGARRSRQGTHGAWATKATTSGTAEIYVLPYVIYTPSARGREPAALPLGAARQGPRPGPGAA